MLNQRQKSRRLRTKLIKLIRLKAKNALILKLIRVQIKLKLSKLKIKKLMNIRKNWKVSMPPRKKSTKESYLQERDLE